MEIGWRVYIYFVINWAYCVAKPVSLNEVIAAESQRKQLVHAVSPKLEEPVAERVSLNKGLKPLLRLPNKFKVTESIIPISKKLSSLKYRKTFQINSPLRPNRIKHSLRRHKRKNQLPKREISGNEKLNEKYIPLLRNLGMLFDNLLGSESGETAELRSKRKRVRYYTDTSEILCPCSSKSNPRIESEEKTATSAEALPEASPPAETTTEAPHTLTTGNFRSFRQNKNIPVLLTRNTFSLRRDYNGFSARSRPAYHGSSERDISGDNGDSKPGAGDGVHGPHAEDDEEDTRGDPRHGARRITPWGRIRSRDTTHATTSITVEETTAKTKANENTLDLPRRNISKYKRQDKQQIRNNKTKSSDLVPAAVGGIRGLVSAGEIDIPESEHESEKGTTQNYTDDQRSSAIPEENQETSTRHKTVNINNIPTNPPDTINTGGPLVYIIDGYSVTRNKNGESKLKEKAIHIESK